MIRQFVTVEELFADHNIERYCGQNPKAVGKAKLSAAERELREMLRSRDALTRTLQVPQMLAGTYSAPTTSDDVTGDSKAIQGTRFVVECFTDATATFTLEGSENGTNWKRVYDRLKGDYIAIETTGAGIYSAPFAESYMYYRFALTTDTPVSYLVYLVDGSIDLLASYKALELIYEDHLGDDKVDRKYEYVTNKYNNLLATFSADVDINQDGAIDTDEQSAKQVHRLNR